MKIFFMYWKNMMIFLLDKTLILGLNKVSGFKMKINLCLLGINLDLQQFSMTLLIVNIP